MVSNVTAFFNILKSMVGSGVLALPFALLHCGYDLAIAILIILMLLEAYCIGGLVEIADCMGKRTIFYAELGEKLVNRIFGNIIKGLMLVY